jgi:DNA transposition AAA+ family ATPase
MSNKPKLIVLYGFAANGKTTIAKKYIDEHPLSPMIEGDEIINMIGKWREFEDGA